MARSRPHSLLLLPSISRSGAGPRNLHFYKHPRESSNSGWRDSALDVKLSEGQGLCLSCSRLNLQGLAWARDITGALSIPGKE